MAPLNALRVYLNNDQRIIKLNTIATYELKAVASLK